MTKAPSKSEIIETLHRVEYESQKLLDAASAVLNSENFSIAARAVFDIAKELTGAKSGYVALLSEDGSENELLFLDAGGLPCYVDESLPMPIRGLREVAYREKRPAYDNGFMNSEWVGFMPEGHVILNNVMFGPLVIGGRAEGLIGLANKEEDFTDDDARIVMALANLVAIGLRKAKIEAELRESQRNLSESVSELQLYASLLRHDLSNDLQLVLGETEIAISSNESQKVAESLSSIESATFRMTRLLQVFQRSEVYDDADLRTILQHLVAENMSSYPRMKISVDINEELGRIKIKGRSLLPFVFDNILRNSVQHVGPSVSVNIYTKLGSEKVTLDFVDDGPGIEEGRRESLFNKGDMKTGQGFGLYLCRKIIESYGGRINLLNENEYKMGTAIRIELPRIYEEHKEKAH